jgi:myb proto-oncogene protein
LDPDVNRGKWTAEEDAKLTEAVTEFGSDWAAVAAMIPGRTSRHCRLRWTKFLDPDVSTGRWTRDEDAKLTGTVKKHGGNNWTAVAALVPGRTNKRCRQRWVDSLDPVISTGKWTAEEMAKLTEAVTERGSDWVRVAVLVPGRTNSQCSRRWYKYLRTEH